MAFMQITVIPIGTQSSSVGEYIAEIEHFLQERAIEHALHDMGTILTGTATELLQIAGEIHNLPFAKGAERVVTNITLDERIDLDRSIGDKVKSVTRKLEDKKYYEKNI